MFVAARVKSGLIAEVADVCAREAGRVFRQILRVRFRVFLQLQFFQIHVEDFHTLF